MSVYEYIYVFETIRGDTRAGHGVRSGRSSR